MKYICDYRAALTGFIAAVALASCGEKPQQPPEPQITQPPVKLFQPQREALEKAKGVGQIIEKSAEELKQEEERQTQ